jgi:hypothetical protein
MLLLSSKYEKTCPDGTESKRIHSCRQAAAEGLDPFLESIPEANREVVVARLFEDFRSATTQAKYIDNGRWRDYGAYADRGYYVIAAHATIMALHRQCPKSFTTLPAHAQELCLGLLLQLVRLAPLVTNPEGSDGTETAREVLGRLSGAARRVARPQRQRGRRRAKARGFGRYSRRLRRSPRPRWSGAKRYDRRHALRRRSRKRPKSTSELRRGRKRTEAISKQRRRESGRSSRSWSGPRRDSKRRELE